MFNTIIGQSAEGDHYFERPYLDSRFWKLIKSESHLLVSAPRRIGKTSFLKNIVAVGSDGYIVKYHITESINHSNEFFKRLYKSLLEELTTKQNAWESIQGILKKNSVKKVGTSGVELGKADLDYFEEFKRLIEKIELSDKLLFIIDEYSETLENIIKDHGEADGRTFLQKNRELRQDNHINRKILFVYSGSIGLGNIAERIDASKIINDIRSFPIPQLTADEANGLISKIIINDQLIFADSAKLYLHGRIKWLIPYYIQIVLDEIENILVQETKMEVTNEIINLAIDQALDVRNYFEHWHTRLRGALKGSQYTFAKSTLNAISKSENGLSKSKVFDLASKNDLIEDYPIIMRTLEYDGYIHLESSHYIFNSPLLRIWWERNIAI